MHTPQTPAYNDHERYRTRVIHVYTEANPNPNSMKFMLNFMLIKDGGSIDFPDVSAAAHSPLAKALFAFPYVKRVFFMNNFVTVTKDEGTEWAEILQELRTFFKDYFGAEKPVFDEEQKELIVEANNDTEVIRKIKGVLDEYIRPAVEMDGGAIQFHAFDEVSGVLKVYLQGSCSGCPSSMVTLKGGIENLMRRMVPQVQLVEAEGI